MKRSIIRVPQAPKVCRRITPFALRPMNHILSQWAKSVARVALQLTCSTAGLKQTRCTAPCSSPWLATPRCADPRGWCTWTAVFLGTSSLRAEGCATCGRGCRPKARHWAPPPPPLPPPPRLPARGVPPAKKKRQQGLQHQQPNASMWNTIRLGGCIAPHYLDQGLSDRRYFANNP